MSIYDEIYNEAFNDELEKVSLEKSSSLKGAILAGLPASIAAGGAMALIHSKNLKNKEGGRVHDQMSNQRMLNARRLKY